MTRNVDEVIKVRFLGNNLFFYFMILIFQRFYKEKDN